VVAKVEGYKKRFTLVGSAVGLTGLQMVELFAARFRQETGQSHYTSSDRWCDAPGSGYDRSRLAA
jgi:hypothetical protein